MLKYGARSKEPVIRYKVENEDGIYTIYQVLVYSYFMMKDYLSKENPEDDLPYEIVFPVSLKEKYNYPLMNTIKTEEVARERVVSEIKGSVYKQSREDFKQYSENPEARNAFDMKILKQIASIRTVKF